MTNRSFPVGDRGRASKYSLLISSRGLLALPSRGEERARRQLHTPRPARCESCSFRSVFGGASLPNIHHVMKMWSVQPMRTPFWGTTQSSSRPSTHSTGVLHAYLRMKLRLVALRDLACRSACSSREDGAPPLRLVDAYAPPCGRKERMVRVVGEAPAAWG
jgi:hypothetical protein